MKSQRGAEQLADLQKDQSCRMKWELLNDTHCLSHTHTHTKHARSVVKSGFQNDIATDIMQEINEI